MKQLPKHILPFYTVETLQERLEWVVNLRWLIVFGILSIVPVSQEMIHLELGYSQIIIIALVILVMNIVYYFLIHFAKFKTEFQELVFVEIQVVIDLFILSALIHYSGGIENPFYFLYVIFIILSGFLFPGILMPMINAVLASSLLTVWTYLEYTNRIARYSLGSGELTLPHVLTSLLAFYVTTLAGIFIVHNFVLSYRSLKRIIDHKNELLEETMNERREFFRYTAHELKSPITSIQSTLAVANTTFAKDLTPQVKDMITRAELRSSQLLDMVNEMIEITKYKEGIKVVDFQCVYFNAWLMQIMDNLRPIAESKKITLKCECLKKELEICFDRFEMDKVLTNLVNNAIRYTPEKGAVTVRPFTRKSKYGFSVTDTGIGIEKENLDRIFSEFFRTPNAKKMERTGTGLGLNLVKEIVTRHGGTIQVSSEVGKGSVFTVTLPVEEKS